MRTRPRRTEDETRREQTHGGSRSVVRAVIVVQVEFTVAFPAIVYVEQWELRHVQAFDAGFAAKEYPGGTKSRSMLSIAPGNERRFGPRRRACFVRVHRRRAAHTRLISPVPTVSRPACRSRTSRCCWPTPPSCWESASSLLPPRRASAWSRQSRCGWIRDRPSRHRRDLRWLNSHAEHRRRPADPFVQTEQLEAGDSRACDER